MNTVDVFLMIGMMFIGFLIGAFITWSFSKARSGEVSKQLHIELAEHKTRLSELENVKNRLESECRQFETKMTELQIRVAEMSKEREMSIEQISSLKETISGLQDDNARLRLYANNIQVKLAEVSKEREMSIEQISSLRETISGFQDDNARLRLYANDIQVKLAEMSKEREADLGKIAWIDSAQEQMREAFMALASKTLQTNSEHFLERSDEKLSSVVTPLKEGLSILAKQVSDLETKREGAYKGLEEQLRQLSVTHTDLQRTTVSLTQALRSPTVRGRWGELQLRRVVEMAGMVKNVSYAEQVSADSGRPDMIIYLPNDGILALDAKVPLEAYLDAMESKDASERRNKLSDHAKAMKSRVRELSRKQYWDQFDKSPEFVVMFVPNEACLGAAFDFDPGLLEAAMNQRVLITTPVTLLALLKAVTYGWQQHQLTENSKKIAEEGKELYQRLAILINHLADMQRNLNRTVISFNKTVGSLESRLIPSAKRFEDMGIATTEIATPGPVDTQVRLLEVIEE